MKKAFIQILMKMEIYLQAKFKELILQDHCTKILKF